MLTFKNLDQTASYALLQEWASHPPSSHTLSAHQVHQFMSTSSLVNYHYAGALVNADIVSLLQIVAKEQEVVDKYKALLAGAPLNTSENRPVLHHQLRSTSESMYSAECTRLFSFAHTIRSSQKFTDVVQVGIGGSDLGPRLLVHTLSGLDVPYLKPHFLTSVDPDELNRLLPTLPPDTTLWIVASKSGSTLETQSNLSCIQPPPHQTIVLTTPNSPLDRPQDFLDIFYIDHSIGGRFSSTSIMGMTIVTLCFGQEVVEDILSGARQMDEDALCPDSTKNPSLMAALIGVWIRSFLSMPALGIIPYSTALAPLPAFIRQLDCESNGKQVNRDGDPIGYPTSPVIFGECGTNCQHSFFQKIHQGTDPIPIEFIGFRHAQTHKNPHQHMILNANLISQMTALALGQDHDNPNQRFVGSRPYSLLLANRMDAKTLGALISFYENKIMFQGFLWNLNSFDQEGVQLGKRITQDLLQHKSTYNSSLLQTWQDLLR